MKYQIVINNISPPRVLNGSRRYMIPNMGLAELRLCIKILDKERSTKPQLLIPLLFLDAQFVTILCSACLPI